MCFALGLSIASAAGAVAADDPVAAFYRGRTVEAIVGYTPGSTFEFYMRAFAPYFARHIPGNPTIIVQHMPGAGSLKATAYLASLAPKDGSVIGIINPVNTVEPLLDPANARFDPLTFRWIGSLNAEISTCAFWSRDLKTLADLKRREVVLGSTGPSSGSTVDARVLGALGGLKFKIVTSYPGLAEVRLAAERGEVDGHCGLQVSAIKSLLWDDFRAGKFSVPVQMGLRKHPDMPDVPNAYDLAATEEDRALFRLNFGPWSFGRPLLAPPGTPADRVQALRAAFTDAVADPEFLAEAKKLNMEVQPTSAETIEHLVAEILRTPMSVVERARVLLGVQNR
ncbi:MAG TPA: tripartite tricarboxylate transporter substrate-binding protein [Xanthobacteraceae bacterium]|nr:tripartite tricarboxylate transporter substrate-binding protein [Xanthobacteraceae bacterium]